MLQTIEVEIDAQGGIHPLQALPLTAERRALLTLVIPEKASAPTDWRNFIGALKDSPCFSGDPAETHRTMRDDWR